VKWIELAHDNVQLHNFVVTIHWKISQGLYCLAE